MRILRRALGLWQVKFFISEPRRGHGGASRERSDIKYVLEVQTVPPLGLALIEDAGRLLDGTAFD